METGRKEGVGLLRALYIKIRVRHKRPPSQRPPVGLQWWDWGAGRAASEPPGHRNGARTTPCLGLA